MSFEDHQPTHYRRSGLTGAMRIFWEFPNAHGVILFVSPENGSLHLRETRYNTEGNMWGKTNWIHISRSGNAREILEKTLDRVASET